MLGRVVVAALMLMALPAPSYAQPLSCAAAPSLEPALKPALSEPPSWKAYDAAVKAQRVWSAPRMSYGACRRAEIDALGKRVNALGAEINALVDEVGAIEKRVKSTREVRNAAFRLYGARRNRGPEDWPVAAAVGLQAQAPPCAAPAIAAAPVFADGSTANATTMRRADEKFHEWAAPLEGYVACRKVERQVKAAEHQALSDELASTQASYASYRAAFNTAVARYQTALDAYVARLPKR